MKLLLDENLSDRIVPHILELFPESTHIKTFARLRACSSWSDRRPEQATRGNTRHLTRGFSRFTVALAPNILT